MQRKRSAVWRHFKEEEGNKVSCRACKKQLTKHGNTSMMLRHLRGKHPELISCVMESDTPAVQEEEMPWQIDEHFLDMGDTLQPIETSVLKKKRSTVWQHFEEEGPDKVACRLCHEKLAKHGNTSSMLRHLRGKHPQLKLGELPSESKKLNRLHLKAGNTENRFLSVCERLLHNNHLTDCTLMAEDQLIQVHRLVLATCSDSFEELFKTVQQPNPVIVLRDITMQELRGLINYMYKGEALVKANELPGLLKAAAQLKIKGLSQVGLGDSWGEEQPIPGSSSHASHHRAKEDLSQFYDNDPDIEDEDEEIEHPYPQSNPAVSRKRRNPALDLMAMCEEVDLDLSGSLQQEDGRPFKRMHIKVEDGIVNDDDDPPLQISTSMNSQNPATTTQFLSAEEEVPFTESIEIGEPSSRIIRTSMTMNDGDGLGQAVKVAHSQGNEEVEEQTVASFVTTDSVLEVDSGQQGNTAVQESLDSGLMILGLPGNEGQEPVFAPGPSRTTFSQSEGISSLQARRGIKRYSKQDLVTALKLISDGHLGIKPAAKAFSIPIATLYNATKKHETASQLQHLKGESSNTDSLSKPSS